MATIFDRILSLFNTPHGNLIFILVVLLFSFGAFQACTYASGRQVSMEGKRMRLGLVSLLLAQLFLFLVAWMSWLGVIEEHALLPILDRIIALFNLVLIIWLWAFPKRIRIVDEIVLAIEASILIAGVISLIWWSNQSSVQFFNSSSLGAYAYYAGIALIGVGLFLLIWKRPNSWGIGVTMLVILFGGYLAQYLFRQPAGDYAWLVRLGEMFAIILLLELPRRLVPGKEVTKFPEAEKTIFPLPTWTAGEITQSIPSQELAQAEPQTALQQLQDELDYQRQEYAQLKQKYDELVSPMTGAVVGLGVAASKTEDQNNLEETIRLLEDRNRELEALVTKGRPSIEEVEQLREELRAALTDLARIPTTLSKSDQKMLELQLSTMRRLDDMGQTELVTSIAQEFRQPLSAIIGYTDLLLAETAGLLGAMQRNFLERVKASTERLGILINELIQVLAIDSGKVDQTLTKVDLEALIDEAVGNIIAQISEKNITMRVDLPEQLPEIRANKEAMHQILANLLENACTVTPDEGEIRLFARIEQKENEPTLLHVSVTDQGGGIAEADIPHIFARRYKLENPLIQGIGDTGVGLSIVKSLVELNKGRIWVDTIEGSGSTFSVLLPLYEDQPEEVVPTRF